MRVAIIEDSPADLHLMQAALDRYASEKKLCILQETFDNAVSFLERYRAVYDVVFMDIRLPMLDGMAAARKLRDIDRTVPLIFITDMQQYAIQGYRVGAIDYFLKPINYYDLKMRMDMLAVSDRGA